MSLVEKNEKLAEKFDKKFCLKNLEECSLNWHARKVEF